MPVATLTYASCWHASPSRHSSSHCRCGCDGPCDPDRDRDPYRGRVAQSPRARAAPRARARAGHAPSPCLARAPRGPSPSRAPCPWPLCPSPAPYPWTLWQPQRAVPARVQRRLRRALALAPLARAGQACVSPPPPVHRPTLSGGPDPRGSSQTWSASLPGRAAPRRTNRLRCPRERATRRALRRALRRAPRWATRRALQLRHPRPSAWRRRASAAPRASPRG
mmetsp:Transcript_22020/g.50624  ORF Transcript_22020/g.50624 Transcript_22020/m.50624 type:complete len:223 (-) Transcript_22020:2392-3060(-)